MMLRTYKNGPEGMERVMRMPDAVLECIISNSIFRPFAHQYEGENRDRLHGLMHDTAEEALARVRLAAIGPTPPAPSQTAGASIVRFTDYGDGIEPCETGAFIRYADHQQAVADALAGQAEAAIPEAGKRLLAATKQRAEKAEAERDAALAVPKSPHPEYDAGFSEGWDRAKAALAQVAGGQVPVAYCVPDKNGKPLFGKGWMFGQVSVQNATMPLYATPQPAPVLEKLPEYSPEVKAMIEAQDIKEYEEANREDPHPVPGTEHVPVEAAEFDAYVATSNKPADPKP